MIPVMATLGQKNGTVGGNVPPGIYIGPNELNAVRVNVGEEP